MAKNHLLGIIVELAQGDKAPALLHNLSAGNLEALRIREDAWVLLLRQDALLAPGAEVARGSRVDAFAPLRIEEFGQAENDSDQVVGAALVVSLLHRWGDFVVRLSYHVVQPDNGRIVAPCTKWVNAGHTESLSHRLSTNLRAEIPFFSAAGGRRA